MCRTILGIFAAFCLPAASWCQPVDLSPAQWPDKDRGELQAKQQAFVPKATREVRGRMLVVGDTPIAVHAGMEALRQGGSAADAAAVTALTQIATTMGGTVSYAGKLEVAYYDARTKEVTFLDAGWSPYAGETAPATIPDLGASPPAASIGRQTLVPGFMRGLETLHTRYGSLTWRQLFAPAIWYAENGVLVSQATTGFRQANDPRFSRTPEGQAFLRTVGGDLPKVGDLVRQPELALLLQAVARRGADDMYRGAWAANYVEAVDRYGGKASLQDLARYRPEWRASIQTGFADATVYGMSGGSLACSSLSALSLLNAMGVDRMGPYWNDSTAFRAYARAIQYATLRQYLQPGPTAFERSAGLPASGCADRLTGSYASRLADELLRPEPRPFGAPTIAAVAAGHHTMAVIAVDRRGDVAVLVHSANGAPTGIVVGGVPIPEAASVNKREVGRTHAVELVTNDIAPLVALRGDKPVAAVGATGTSLMPETVRLMAAMIAGRQPLATVTSAPPLLYNFSPPPPDESLDKWAVLVPARAYDEGMRSDLTKAGVKLEDRPPLAAWTVLRGTAAAVRFDAASGAATAVEVPEVDYFVEAAP
jgi:gamma-glutamyltranspeptidase/glutathione hydrolase